MTKTGIDIEKNFRKLLIDLGFIHRHRTHPSHFNRNTFLKFDRIVGLILQKMTKSLQIEANLLSELLNRDFVSKQALSQGRLRVGVSAFQELHEVGLKMHYENNSKRLWKGYRVFGGDGSTLQFPKRGDIAAFFGDHFKRTALGRVMQYVELTSDVVVAADLMPYKVSEDSMANTMLPRLTQKFRSFGQDKQIYVYDRGFPSHAFAQRHLNLGVDFLFRLQKRYSPLIKNLTETLQEIDTIIDVKRGLISYQARLIIKYLSSGQPLILMTSLIDQQQFKTEEIVALYELRWRSEESYKFQKILLGLDNSYSRNYQAIAQDFWATVVLSMLMCIRFNEVEEGEESTGNCQTKINRTVVFSSLKTLYLKALMGEVCFEEYEERFQRLCKKHRCQIRPGRSYPRLSVDTRKTRHCHRRF